MLETSLYIHQDKTNITVIACGNHSTNGISGKTQSPLPLKKSQAQCTAWAVGGLTLLFEAWFTDQFLAYALKTRPLLLILDGHASHYQPNLVRLAAKECVILFFLPPHCTHLAQPLNKGAFSPLKTYWHQECESLWRIILGKLNIFVIISGYCKEKYLVVLLLMCLPKKTSSIHELLQIPDIPLTLKKKSEKKFRTTWVQVMWLYNKWKKKKRERKRKKEKNVGKKNVKKGHE